MIKTLVFLSVVFFVINAIFWGLMPHRLHCYVVDQFGIKCSPHYVHMAMGALSFLMGMAISQSSYVYNMKESWKRQLK